MSNQNIHFSSPRFALLALPFALFGAGNAVAANPIPTACTETDYSAVTTCYLPPGVTQVKIEAWGGGGGGSQGNSTETGSGGGGGSYCGATFSLTEGATLSIAPGPGGAAGSGLTGSAGTSSLVSGTGVVGLQANGGSGGFSSLGWYAGAGGTTAACTATGATAYAGGRGYGGTGLGWSDTYGGGGGASATNNSVGNDANRSFGGPRDVDVGGIGGQGTTLPNSFARAGGSPGGGGGGGHPSASVPWGQPGGAGSVKLTFLLPVTGGCGTAHATTPPVLVAPSGGALCSTGTVSSVTTSAGAYTWTCAGANGGADSGTCSATRGYTVTPSAGANGSISPNTPQVVAYNATTSFTVTPSSGYQASASGCGGSLSGNTFTTGAITAACSVSASFGVQQSYSAPSPTGSGNIITTVSGAGGECGFASSSYQQASSAGGTPPAGLTFPHGVLNFTTNTCASNGTLNVTINYPQPLAAGAKFYKYGPATRGATTFTWYEHPATISQDRLSVSYSVTDGDQGDSSATPGVITDPAGAAEPAAIAAGVTSVPTLSEWGMIIMSSLMMLFGIAQVRRRQGTGL